MYSSCLVSAWRDEECSEQDLNTRLVLLSSAFAQISCSSFLPSVCSRLRLVQGFFRHRSVDQKSVKCIGEAYLTCNTLVMSLICSGFSPKISHPSGDLRASRWSTCVVSPACICALSMPISRCTCPLPWRNHVLGRPRNSGKYQVFTVGISSLMMSMPIT